jgi:hypothetical protein
MLVYVSAFQHFNILIYIISFHSMFLPILHSNRGADLLGMELCLDKISVVMPQNVTLFGNRIIEDVVS